MKIYRANIQVAVVVRDDHPDPQNAVHTFLEEALGTGGVSNWQYEEDEPAPYLLACLSRQEWRKWSKRDAFKNPKNRYKDFEVSVCMIESKKERFFNHRASEIAREVNLLFSPEEEYAIVKTQEGVEVRHMHKPNSLVASIKPTHPTPNKVERLQGLLY